MTFSTIVAAARSGALSRRSFLAAAAALGLGADDALAELPRKLHSLPAHLARIWGQPKLVVGVDFARSLPSEFYDVTSAAGSWTSLTVFVNGERVDEIKLTSIEYSNG